MISFTQKCYSDSFVYGSKSFNSEGRVFVFGQYDSKLISKLIREEAPSWQREALSKKEKDVTHFVGDRGPVWIVARKPMKGGRRENQTPMDFTESDYAWYRDQVGSLLPFFKAYGLGAVQFNWQKTRPDQEQGAMLGLDLASYSYKAFTSDEPFQNMPVIGHDKKWPKEFLRDLRARSTAMNLSRHLVNEPPNLLNPKTYGDFIKKQFSSAKNLKIEIWNADRLAKENMGLHLGVGRGAENGPCLVVLKYRPTTAAKSLRPIALVGKGITFDSGGLDIKPSSGMRLMKKDMGGSACVLGVLSWAVNSAYPRPLDVYLALAENSVDAAAMRPSDVLTARNGLKVEIHNTDAEGRLVLADALDVAVEGQPEVVIDVATLTGAIKVALGADLAGLFSNRAGLSEEIFRAGERTGDLNWKMPLFRKYSASFSTQVGDMVNAVDGFGGAITAALFLEKFVKDTPWAHLDIYAWADKASGALTVPGGSGQAVQCLVDWLTSKAANRSRKN